MIAEWVNSYPAIVAKYFRKVPGGFETLRDRLLFPAHSLPFRSGLDRNEGIKYIQEVCSVNADANHVRIEGQAGVGKSRVVMEALRDKVDLTLYAETPPESQDALIALVPSPKTAIIVLDECDYGTAKLWEQRLGMAEGRVKLVTIGTNEEWGSGGSQVIELSLLGREELVAVARDNAPGLLPNELEWVADMCEGFVKLAGPLALALDSSDKVPAAALVEDRDVVEVLRRLIGEEAEFRAMSGLALFMRVGFEGELQVEARAVASYLELEWRVFHAAAERMLARGLLARRGRYVYVTPTVLAIWLVALELRRQGQGIMGVLRNPKAPANELFWKRFGQLEGNRDAERLAGEVLGEDSPFRTMEHLNSERSSRLLLELAKVAPVQAGRLLDQLTEQTSPDALKGMRAGRRNLVWALESLAERADTFEVAAGSLVRLAAAENESYANNATGVFHSLFQTFLGPSILPGPDRLGVLAGLLDTQSDDQACLAIEALGSALSTSEIGRATTDPVEGKAPSDNWQPTSRREERAVRETALAMLRQELRSDSERRSAAAVHVFLQQLGDITRLGFGPEARDILNEIPVDMVSLYEREFLGSIGRLIEHDLPRFDESEQSEWRAAGRRFLGGSFHTKLRARVNGWDERSWFLEYNADEDFQRDIEELARSAIEDPSLLDDELDWLSGNKDIPNLSFFGKTLGTQDMQGSLVGKLVEAGSVSGNARLFASYLGGKSLSDEELQDFVESLDVAHGDSLFLAHLLLCLPPTPYTAEKLLASVSRSPEAQQALDYSAVVFLSRKVPQRVISRLVDELMDRNTPGSMFNALTIIDQELAEDGDGDAIPNLAWKVLEKAVPILLGSPSPLGEYQWTEVSKKMAAVDRKRVVGLFLDRMEQKDKSLYGVFGDAFSDVMSEAEVASWECFAERLERSPLLGLSFSFWLQRASFLDRVPLATLKAWARDDADRLEVLAELSRVGDELTPLNIWLVEQAGPTSRAARKLRSQMRTGFFAGSQVGLEQSFLTQFERWASDDNLSAAVRQWARDGASETREGLPSLQRREDETFWD